MISHKSLKLIFSKILLKTSHMIVWKHLRVFYFLIWWNLKNLYVVNFRIFLKKYENKYNIFKAFLLINNNNLLKQYNHSKIFNIFMLDYLNVNLIYLIKKNKSTKLLTFYLTNSNIFLTKNDNFTKYSIYYNFYNLFYLNKCY